MTEPLFAKIDPAALNTALAVCCAALLLIPVISSVFLIVACRVCGVKPPSVLVGVGITLAAGFACTLAGFIVIVAVGTAVAQSGGGPEKIKAMQLPASVFNLALQTAITSVIYGLFLNVDAIKGFLVLVVQSILWCVLGFGVVLLLFAANPDLAKQRPQWERLEPFKPPANSP